MTQSGVKPTIEVFQAVFSAIRRSSDVNREGLAEGMVEQMKMYGLTVTPSSPPSASSLP